jgi:hypothetical protein
MLRVAFQAGKLTETQYTAETAAVREMVDGLANRGHGGMARFREVWTDMGG